MNKLRQINYTLYIGILFVSIILFVAIFGPYFAPYALNEAMEVKYSNGQIIAPPVKPFQTESYLLGTDRWGYDLLTMIIYGIRYTMIISLAVTFIKMFFGSIIGLYVGTWKRVPSWVEAIENAWSYIPLFIIVYFFFLPINFNSPLSKTQLIVYFILLTSIISIPSIVSSVRKQVAELKKSDYIQVSKTLGASRHRIIWKHLFPQLKESLLVMFILEIIYVITIMGQLALMNIFIGGTKVTYDPLLFHSVTKEVSGLVGQARGSLYGEMYIIFIPLTVLLFITISFNLLANGFKLRFQSNYQRTPWIKTGLEIKLIPKRKAYGIAKKWYSFSKERLALIGLLVVFVGAGAFVIVKHDQKIGVKNGSRAEYQIKVKMNESGEFTADVNVEVKNKSNQKWNDLVFYFIPNVFQKGHSFKDVKGFSTIKMEEIRMNDANVDYSLKKDTLRIKLPESMGKNEKRSLHFRYQFTLPEEGNRLSKVGDRYYLAQWYPMLATYQKGKWNKENYVEGLESYHTDFSSFDVSYEVPKGYSFVSTGAMESKSPSGRVKVKQVREFFGAVLKDMKRYETEVNGVKIQLFTKNDHDKKINQTLKLAKNALAFYQKNIGEYPHQQLAVILDKTAHMEYPGAITVNPYDSDQRFFNNTIVHEIAHQYFYGVVENDPYNEAWLDEGMTEFATSMYFYIAENQSKYEALGLPTYRMNKIKELELGNQFSNLPLHEVKNNGYIYGQPALKLFTIIEDHYGVRNKELKVVIMEYLHDYYEQFKYKQVDTEQFISFTANYFEIPRGAFADWLDFE